jgi:hypothetical protein
MCYFSPALLGYGRHTIKAGQSLTLRYRLIVHPGRWDAQRLRDEGKRSRSPCQKNEARDTANQLEQVKESK